MLSPHHGTCSSRSRGVDEAISCELADAKVATCRSFCKRQYYRRFAALHTDAEWQDVDRFDVTKYNPSTSKTLPLTVILLDGHPNDFSHGYDHVVFVLVDIQKQMT